MNNEETKDLEIEEDEQLEGMDHTLVEFKKCNAVMVN